MAAELGVGNVSAIEVLGRGVSGRVRGIRVHGESGSAVVQYEYPVRKLFGGLPSGLFTVDPRRNAAGTVTHWEFTGAGWGHGVGMDQTGAIGRAMRGSKYSEILAQYYRGAELTKLY